MPVRVVQVCTDPNQGDYWFSPVYEDPDRPMKDDVLTRTPEDVAAEVRCFAVRIERVSVGTAFDYEVKVQVLNTIFGRHLPNEALRDWLLRHGYTQWSRNAYYELFQEPALAEHFPPSGAT